MKTPVSVISALPKDVEAKVDIKQGGPPKHIVSVDISHELHKLKQLGTDTGQRDIWIRSIGKRVVSKLGPIPKGEPINIFLPEEVDLKKTKILDERIARPIKVFLVDNQGKVINRLNNQHYR